MTTKRPYKETAEKIVDAYLHDPIMRGNRNFLVDSLENAFETKDALLKERDATIEALRAQLELLQKGVTLTFDERGKLEMRNQQLQEAWKDLAAAKERAEALNGFAKRMLGAIDHRTIQR